MTVLLQNIEVARVPHGPSVRIHLYILRRINQQPFPPSSNNSPLSST
jgi:hypothetical protein